MKFAERMRAVLDAEAAAIRSVEINGEFERAVQLILDCRGKLLTTGIGKAGHIANKFAATLSSTGTPAVFLHPTEAAHGDLGVVGKNDIVFAFSTSGKSREVLEIFELSRHLGVTHLVGLTSHRDSALRDHCEIILDMGPVKEEACPLGLTPTCSVAVMLAIGDAIAMAVMEARGFTRADYGLLHHGGYLGRVTRMDNLPD